MAGPGDSSLDWFYQHDPDQLVICGHGKHLQSHLLEPFHKPVVLFVLLLFVQIHDLIIVKIHEKYSSKLISQN